MVWTLNCLSSLMLCPEPRRGNPAKSRVQQVYGAKGVESQPGGEQQQPTCNDLSLLTLSSLWKSSLIASHLELTHRRSCSTRSLASALLPLHSFLPPPIPSSPPHHEDRSSHTALEQSELIRHALILVGGFGTRLRPLTVGLSAATGSGESSCTDLSSSHGPNPWSSSATR